MKNHLQASGTEALTPIAGKNSLSFPASTSYPTIQRSAAPGGKKGGGYFSRDGYTDDQIREAEALVGKTSAHGKGKGGTSGISNKTLTEEKELIGALRGIKAKQKASKKSKPKLKQAKASSDFEKAMVQATTTYANDQEAFDEYLENRGYQFSDDELDDLYAALLTAAEESS